MNDLIVITGASPAQGTMPLYLMQLASAGIEYHIEDLSQVVLHGAGGNIAFKFKLMRDFARRFADYEKLVMTDAFDVTFYGKREEVIRKIPKDHVLWAAEKNCYPDASIAAFIRGRTPWKFGNGGMLAGTPESLLKWCDTAEQHPKYRADMLDQEFLNILIAESEKESKRSPLCVIDDRTHLFFNLYGGYDELDFASGMPINTACCTFPNFIHASGHWDTAEMFARYERSVKCIQSLS